MASKITQVPLGPATAFLEPLSQRYSWGRLKSKAIFSQRCARCGHCISLNILISCISIWSNALSFTHDRFVNMQCHTKGYLGKHCIFRLTSEAQGQFSCVKVQDCRGQSQRLMLRAYYKRLTVSFPKGQDDSAMPNMI